MDPDTGEIAWTRSTQTCVGVVAGAVASFLFIFMWLVLRVTNEIIVARR
jgi:hypothetical protein